MSPQEYIGIAQRHSKVVRALTDALEVMKLTHGAKITMAGVTGTLNYEKQMLDLRDALLLLCVDPDETASTGSVGDRQPK